MKFEIVRLRRRIPKKAKITLVCMRLSDMHVVHPEQVEKTCGECGRTVGVYPSGQKALRDHPDAKIQCQVCADKEAFDIGVPAAETRAEYEAEKHASKPR